MNDWGKEVERLRAEVQHLKAMLKEEDNLIAALVRDRNFYRDELARKGGMN